MAEFKIDGHAFPVKEGVSRWTLYALMDSYHSGRVGEQMAGIHRFLNSVVEPAHLPRLDAVMMAGDYDFGVIDHACGELVTELLAGKASSDAGEPSTGSEKTKASPKRVSLSRGTVETVTGEAFSTG